jgi:hypothetical protein
MRSCSIAFIRMRSPSRAPPPGLRDRSIDTIANFSRSVWSRRSRVAQPGIVCTVAEATPGAGADAAAGPVADATGAKVPIHQDSLLYNRVVDELGDEGFALFSRPVPVGSFEFLRRSVLSSHTLGEALDRTARSLRVVVPDL